MSTRLPSRYGAGGPNSPALEFTHWRVTMHTPMKRTLFWLRKQTTVYEYERGLLYREGRLASLLEPGRYVYWSWDPVDITKVSLREMSHVVAGQGILTADRVEVRVSLVAQYRVTDPDMAVHAVENFTEQLHQDLQLALRDVIAGRTIDQLLDGRAELSDELLKLSAEPAKRYGLELRRVGLRDIVLPGEVRQVMLREVEADRAGRADLVKARHEVAAARARANTAKVLAESPEIARLQEIEALMKLAGKRGNVVLLPNLAELFTPRRRDEGRGQ